jgi:response regulator RpfG family c-di-GMP phosphodiesterase
LRDSSPGLAPGGTLNASDARSATAIVVAGDEETRVLLRGLLRLHHLRVEGEAEGATHALELVRDRRPSLLVTDVTLAEGSATALVADARTILPALRVILVAPASRPPSLPANPLHRPDVVLLRPFRIRQFAEALVPGGNPPGAPPP